MILNLTQHNPTPEQVAEGVVPPSDPEWVRALLTFDSAPSPEEVLNRAHDLAEVAVLWSRETGQFDVMIGGAPFLMPPLVGVLRDLGLRPLFASSRRESEEVAGPDGGIIKRSVFRHAVFE